jgi:hypothetical protein
MQYRRRFWLEKVTVQIALVIGVTATAVMMGGIVRCHDPADGVSFLLDGNLWGLTWLALMVWAMAAVAGVVLTHVRPAGAMLAVAAAGAGVCLRSPWARPWLWTRTGQYPRMFGVWAVELLVLMGILLVAGIVLDLVRRLAATKLGFRLWVDPNEEARGESDVASPAAEAPINMGPEHRYLNLLGGVDEFIRDVRSPQPDARRRLTRLLGGMVLMVAITIVILPILLQSPLRGQVLFAVVVSTGLAAYIVQHIMPVRLAMGVLLVPMLTGLVFYALGAVTAPLGDSTLAWAGVKLYAQVLPIDWIFAGSTGTMLGCWLGHRMFEAGYMDKQNEH